MFTQNFEFPTCFPYVQLCSFHMQNVYEFLNKQIYIYDNNKNVYMLIYKKSLKECIHLFHKTFRNFQATYQKELYLLFEKSDNFSQSVHIEWFDSSPLPVCFHFLFKDPPPSSTINPGFPTGVESMGGLPYGGSLKFDCGGGLKSIHGRRIGEVLKFQ